MSFNYNGNLFENVKFDSVQVETKFNNGLADLIRIGNNFGFDAKDLINDCIETTRKNIIDSKRNTYDVICELKHSASSEGRYYYGRSDLTQISYDNKEKMNNAIQSSLNSLNGSSICEWFVKQVSTLSAAKVLLDYADIDNQAMNLEISLKQFQAILNEVGRSSTGDFHYRSSLTAEYGAESDVTIGLSELEKEKLKNPTATTHYGSNNRDIKFIIKKDWFETVQKNDLASIQLNNGKIAAVLESEEASHKDKEENTNLWKLKVAYVKVPAKVCLWRHNTKEDYEKCIHIEELFYAIDKEGERKATGTTPGRAIGTLNRRAKKEMFELMGLDNL
jgi:hypothetical protein